MRKVLVTFVLALSGVAFAQGNTSQPSSKPAADQQASGQKVIKDPAEYNAYMTALNTPDPSAKAAAMEAFVSQYPASIVKMDALQQAMGGYQQAGNQAKVEDVANKILKEDPNDVRALAIVTFIEKNKAKTPEDFAKVRQLGERGLNALPTAQKPEGMAAADFDKLKTQMKEIFAGAAGFAALQAKDYPAAKTFLQQSVQVDPNNLEDVYRLSLAYLESNPIDKTGLWYIARAYHLAQGNAQAQQQFANYGKSKYRRYHGSADGWDQFLASVANQTTPPADIPIAPAPSPQEVACKAVQDNPPDSLSFGDREYVLQYRDAGPQCNKDAADKVWQAIVSKQKNAAGEEVKVKLPGVKVISATADSIDIALTEENQSAGKADVHVKMEKPLTKLPAPGTTTDIIGVFSDYTPNPFMFTMDKGELPAAKAPVKKPPVRKGATAARKKKTG
jgi:tetratricopeptide (TPR) repeat protein